jgi:PAS domain-containing protein
MIGVLTDNTEQHLAEEISRASEERFRIMADTAPVMIWMVRNRQTVHLLQQAVAGLHRTLPSKQNLERLDGGCFIPRISNTACRRMSHASRRAVRSGWITGCAVMTDSTAGYWTREFPASVVEGHVSRLHWIVRRRHRAQGGRSKRREKLAEEQAARAVADAASRSKGRFLALVSPRAADALDAAIPQLRATPSDWPCRH